MKSVKDVWRPYDGSSIESATLQCESNLKWIKQASVIGWAHNKRLRDDMYLVEVDNALTRIYESL